MFFLALFSIEERWKTTCWFYRVFAFFVAIVDVNTYNGCRYFHSEALRDLGVKNLRDFRVFLAMSLLNIGSETQSDTPAPESIPGSHIRIKIDKFKAGSSFTAQRRCRSCTKQGRTNVFSTKTCSCQPEFAMCDACYETPLMHNL